MTTANDKSRRQAASRKRYRRLDELAAHKKWLEAAELRGFQLAGKV